MKTLKDINWNQVYCFYEVARRLSMTEAARALGVSTSTISEQIKKLEEMLGIALFTRHVRRLRLTDDGIELYGCAKEIFEAGGRFLDLVSPTAIGGYPVRVGIQDCISVPAATEFVSRYWDLYAPYGTLNTIRETTFENLLRSLTEGTLDWAVTVERPKSQRFKAIKISDLEIVFCCSPRLLQIFKAPQDILRNIPLARSSWDQHLNDKVDEHLSLHQIYPKEIIETDHREFCIQLAHRGRIVVPLALSSLEKDRETEALAHFRLDERSIHLDMHVVWPSGKERMISIKKLQELISCHTQPIARYDPDLQIRLSEVPADILVEPPEQSQETS